MVVILCGCALCGRCRNLLLHGCLLLLLRNGNLLLLGHWCGLLDRRLYLLLDLGLWRRCCWSLLSLWFDHCLTSGAYEPTGLDFMTAIRTIVLVAYWCGGSLCLSHRGGSLSLSCRRGSLLLMHLHSFFDLGLVCVTSKTVPLAILLVKGSFVLAYRTRNHNFHPGLFFICQ